MAFLGRYGNQPAWWCWQQPVNDLHELAKEVAALLKAESSPDTREEPDRE